MTGSYVFVDASKPDPAGIGRREVPLMPRHTAGLVGMWEEHGKGRIGIEAYYTGEQALDDNPYRTRSRPYLHLGLLGEITLGNVSLPVDLCVRLQADFAGSPVVALSDGRQHPVCALWPISALDAVTQYAERGGRSLRGILQELGVHAIEWSIGETPLPSNRS